MKTQFFLACALALPTFSIALPQSAAAVVFPKISIGSAATYCALGATTVTNTGNTICNRDVGVSPGTAITGFPPGTGTLHKGDASASAAQTAAHAAYTSAIALTPAVDLTGQDLGGKTLTPNVYKFSSSAQLTGTLTLDGRGDKNAQFVFQIGSTITTASASKVVLLNGARACHVIWAVGSSATLGTTTAFQGDVLAVASITATTGVSNVGSLIALGAAVTLDTNNLKCVPTCPIL